MARVLVVEDTALMQMILKKMLVQAGHEVTLAANGRQCLEQVAGERPDLVLMDQFMPEMDGLDALRSLRADPATATLPVIMASAAQDADEIAAFAAAGANGHVAKPFQVQQLLAEIGRVLQG